MRVEGFQCSWPAKLLACGFVMVISQSFTEARNQHQHSNNRHHGKTVESLSLISNHVSTREKEKHLLGADTFNKHNRSTNFHPEKEFGSKNEKLQEKDSCRHLRCKTGHVCRTDALDGWARCSCAEEGHCGKRGRRRVCGSDGRFYDNHCEMHRLACIRNERIRAIRDKRICLRHPLSLDSKNLYESNSSSKEDRSSVKKDHSFPANDQQPATRKDQSFGKHSHASRDDKPPSPTMNSHLSVKKDLAQQPRLHGSVMEASRSPEGEKSENEGNAVDEDEEEEMKDSATNEKIKEQRTNDAQSAVCTKLAMEKLLKTIMKRQCLRMGIRNCDKNMEWRQSAASDIFNDLDFNSDLYLKPVELNSAEQIADDLGHEAQDCQLQDLITFYDSDHDDRMSLAEFYSAFGVTEDGIQVSKTIVVAGTSLELKCDILNGTSVAWKRNGRSLGSIYNNEIKVLNDGSLYIRDVSLNHIGNYSCYDQSNRDAVHTHMVSVNVFPIVRVSPLTQFHISGSTTTLRCHAEGVPIPDLSWDFNENPLPDQPDHYLVLHRRQTLQIKDSKYMRDTGAFKCKAQNAVGMSQDIATVFIENSDVPKYGQIEEPFELFLVFHETGYSVNEPSHCHIQHIVTGDFSAFKYKPDFGNDLVQTLCKPNSTCSWGDAVNVRNKFIYATQPDLHRVIVFEIRDRFNPVEIISTDKVPVQIGYVDHLDEIWVLCWNQAQRGSANKTSIIIRQASFDIKHHTIHTQTFGSTFAAVSELFLPPNNALNHRFSYGYATDTTKHIYKVDLAAMKIARKIDLDCNPTSVAFVALGGKVIVNCKKQDSESHCLILDYLTDEVFEAPELTGDPYVSPDSRFIVMVNNVERKVSIHHITDEGLMEHSFDENVNMYISDVAFLAAERSYDFFASSSDRNSILYLSLVTGQIETIEGVGMALDNKGIPWRIKNRIIVSGGMFSDFLMTTSVNSIIVIDGRRRHQHCEWQEDTIHANVIVWAEVSRL